MINFNRKNKKINYGGYRTYRTPKVFAGRVKKEKNHITLPKLSFSIWKKVIAVAILVIAFFYVFFSPKFYIKDIIVQGNNLVSADDLKSYVPNHANIFRFNATAAKAKILKDNPEIKDVQIIRGLPDALKISVAEHENKMIWQTGADKYLVSVQGEITKKLGDGDNFNYPLVVDSKPLPVTPGVAVVDPSFVAFVNNVSDKFFEVTNIKPTNFEVIETTFDVNLHTDAGFYVKFNTLRSSQVQLDNLKKILVAKRADVHEYVDLRIDGWAYYK